MEVARDASEHANTCIGDANASNADVDSPLDSRVSADVGVRLYAEDGGEAAENGLREVRSGSDRAGSRLRSYLSFAIINCAHF